MKDGKKKIIKEQYVLENDAMESFPIIDSNEIKTGIAGYSAHHSHSVFSENAQDDIRFVPYIDDPKSLDPLSENFENAR